VTNPTKERRLHVLELHRQDGNHDDDETGRIDANDALLAVALSSSNLRWPTDWLRSWLSHAD